ncbi:MAG: hypothetical protein ACM31E_01540, partial [Fibrobacterota bacterium]
VLKMNMGLYGVMLANVIDESWRAIINYIKFFVSTRSGKFKNSKGNPASVRKTDQPCIIAET